jgi:uncharacterized protein YukE
MSSQIDELKSILLDQQRQIVQLFELYERAKQTQDHNKYSSNQSIGQLKDSLIQIAKEVKSVNRQVFNVEKSIAALQDSNDKKLDTIISRLNPPHPTWSPDFNFCMYGNMDSVPPLNLAESQV